MPSTPSPPRYRLSLRPQYRWVYIRSDTRLPQVLSAGRRLVVGEQRFKLVTKVARRWGAEVQTGHEGKGKWPWFYSRWLVVGEQRFKLVTKVARRWGAEVQARHEGKGKWLSFYSRWLVVGEQRFKLVTKVARRRGAEVQTRHEGKGKWLWFYSRWLVVGEQRFKLVTKVARRWGAEVQTRHEGKGKWLWFYSRWLVVGEQRFRLVTKVARRWEQRFKLVTKVARRWGAEVQARHEGKGKWLSFYSRWLVLGEQRFRLVTKVARRRGAEVQTRHEGKGKWLSKQRFKLVTKREQRFKLVTKVARRRGAEVQTRHEGKGKWLSFYSRWLVVGEQRFRLVTKWLVVGSRGSNSSRRWLVVGEQRFKLVVTKVARRWGAEVQTRHEGKGKWLWFYSRWLVVGEQRFKLVTKVARRRGAEVQTRHEGKGKWLSFYSRWLVVGEQRFKLVTKVARRRGAEVQTRHEGKGKWLSFYSRWLVVGEQRFKLVTKVEDERVALQTAAQPTCRLLTLGLLLCAGRKGTYRSRLLRFFLTVLLSSAANRLFPCRTRHVLRATGDHAAVRPDGGAIWRISCFHLQRQTCLASQEPGTSSEQQVITQLSGPTEVQYGESAVFTCNVRPAWPVKVTWLKDGAEIPATTRVFTQKVQRVAAEDGGGELLQATLTVDSVRTNKTFTCRIETEPAEERSVSVVVRVARVQSLRRNLTQGHACVESRTDRSKLTGVVSTNRKTYTPTPFPPPAPPSVVCSRTAPRWSSPLGPRRRRSAELPGNTVASTIYIDGVSFSDNGHYVCYIPGASKDILNPISKVVKLRRPPRLLGVTGGNFFEDEPLTLRCSTQYAKHNQRPPVTWNFEGLPLDPRGYESRVEQNEYNVTVHELVIPVGRSHHSGSYECPLPSEVEVEEGRPLEVSCTAVGRPLPSVQWEKLERAGPSSPDAAPRREFARTQGIPAEVVEMMSPEDVLEGDNFTVLCTVANFIGPVDFWFTAPRSKPPCSRYSLETYLRDDGLMNVYLTVQEATLEDSGFYECHAGPERPWEVLDLKASHATLGQDFFLSCTVKDWPRKVTFYHNGKVISELDDARYTVHAPDASEEEGAPLTHVMKVAKARPEDEGVYQCSLDGYSSSSVTVAVEEPREEVLAIAASAAVLGRDFNITCRVQNWDEDVTFVHNNVVVEPEREWRYEVTKRPGERPEVSSHVLTVTNASLDDAGYYECYTSRMAFDAVAVEVWREADVTLELQTLDRPNWMDAPIPMNCKVAGVDPNKVTIMFLQEDTPRVAIQNKTKMSTSNDLVSITITDNPDAPSLPETTFTLGFYSLSHNHSGFWSCEVLHPSGASLGKAVLFLEVADIPKFVVKPPEEVYEDLGEDLYLNCSTSGPRETSVAWFRKGIPEPIV
ncbi:hypothetical protein C7M84_009012, partial [Penaeus vannamei]